ncbi:mRNA-capping enzyme [Broome reovirus]|uniref:mRNA-capping enzyme n=1 Tax=Broome reovirus TaxID=667093 RepID=D6MM21_9REOV|nr:lambda C [Broome reovirus]ACU68601.1 mRNA-capping enzyme [Broome reovirus]
MAQFYGIRFGNTLNCPTQYRESVSYTYAKYCDDLSCLETKLPWRPLRNTRTNVVVAVQLFRPLQGTISSAYINEWPSEYESWVTWIKDRLACLRDILLQRFNMIDYYDALVNPIVANLICGLYLHSEPIGEIIESLFLRQTVYQDLRDMSVNVPGFLTYHSDSVELNAGRKYYRFNSYVYDDFDPCLFTKDCSNYGRVFFYRNDNDLMSSNIDALANGVVLCHYDRPSYGSHAIIPNVGNGVPFCGIVMDSVVGVMFEAVCEQLRNNQLASLSQQFSRLDECYGFIRARMFESARDNVFIRLQQLGVLATNGFQLATRLDRYPTNKTIAELYQHLMFGSGDDFDVVVRPRVVYVFQDGPCVLDGLNDHYVRTTRRLGFNHGAITITDPVDGPIRVGIQYKHELVSKCDALSAMAEVSSSAIPIVFNDFWVGEPFTFSYVFSFLDLARDLHDIPNIPHEYFSLEHQYARDVFSKYRGLIDRSYYKDKAILRHVYSIKDPNDVLFMHDHMNVAYFGASGTHPAREPTILREWRDGKLDGVSPPIKVTQFGYDVTKGMIIDVSVPFRSSVYTYIYSDIDQVVDGGDDIDAATRVLFRCLDNMLGQLSHEGNITFKVNFPTTAVWRRLGQHYFPRFASFSIVKPMIANNIEIYVSCYGYETRRPRCDVRMGVHLFMASLYRRYAVFNRITDYLIPRGALESSASGSGVFEINIPSHRVSASIDFMERAIAGMYALNYGGTIRMAHRDYYGVELLSLSGVKNEFAERRLARLDMCPKGDLRAILHQTRLIHYKPAEYFHDAATLWIAYTAFSNYMIYSLGVRQDTNLVADMGAGPEARILSLIPSDMPCLLLDVRPFAESLIGWKYETQFIIFDYLHDRWDNLPPFDTVICTLSLGAACASAQITMIEGIERFLNLCVLHGVKHILLQINCNLDGSSMGVRNELRIDDVNHQYNFLKYDRVEPYTDRRQVEHAIDKLSHCAYAWYTAPLDFDWVHFIWKGLSAVSTVGLQGCIELSRYMPFVVIDNPSTRLRYNNQPVVGQTFEFDIHGVNFVDDVVWWHDGVEVARYSNDVVTTLVGPIACTRRGNDIHVVWDLHMSGLFHLTLTDDELRGRIGSVFVEPPDPAIIFQPPTHWDQTVNGTKMVLNINTWYKLEVFVYSGDTRRVVNPDKYDLIDVAGTGYEFIWVCDRSDAFHRFVVHDTQSEAIGQYVHLELSDLTTHQWDETQVSLISPPDRRRWQVESNGDVIATFNDGQIDVIPPNWVRQDISYSALDEFPTYMAPAGRYRLIRT